MRATVMLSDYVIFVPALLAYVHYAIPSVRRTDKVHPPPKSLLITRQLL